MKHVPQTLQHEDAVRKLSERFRTAAVAISKDEDANEWVPLFLKEFPCGACGEVSTLLAKYLEENNCGQFYYYFGLRDKCSHAWLQQRNLIVDITADQFPDQNCPVIVTEDHSWHSQFNGVCEHIADFEQHDDLGRRMLRRLYNIIHSKT